MLTRVLFNELQRMETEAWWVTAGCASCLTCRNVYPEWWSRCPCTFTATVVSVEGEG